MAITHRTFAKFELTEELKDIKKLRDKLDNFFIARTEDGQTLNSLIRLDDSEGRLGPNTKVLFGTIFDEYVKSSSRIITKGTENNVPKYVIESDPFIDIRAGLFWISNDGTIVFARKEGRTFGSNAISRALGVGVNPIKINIKKVADDFTDNWIGSIVGREGNWQKGTLHGDNLRADDCVGAEFTACAKNQLGGYTGNFGGSIKFKVTKEGVITLYTDLNEDIGNFLRFVNDEIKVYFE
ncbi:hypothetical protein [Methanosarcina mazei]|uniref:Uncharacterized protein n=1 Tax=Methanosarcina mazei TaxID=2209 RepID=A0A0F8IQ40_METMZ|nr:hypothetical protein [Methanosarcina mazei]KKG65538.1 hypothetical protein DU67_16685 [Methanosarcina mazei]KKG79010.1 hypothetical protein DU55_18050 [Methanosarcina mazei]WIM42006.1 hypothetical protein PSF70_10690 [Methanosarcina mazei]WIM45456.1 hypothetical protein PQQ20_10615 [Methanosarcina mazei]